MNLVVATQTDIDHLMSWFPTERSVDIWGGPNFRYPFTAETFHEDVRWKEMDTFCLMDTSGDISAFGQMYERHGRINLARLVVAPGSRGQGIGQKLVAALIDEGRRIFSLPEFSLYVYHDNEQALACYRRMGFEEDEYPEDDELAESCIYMTRPV